MISVLKEIPHEVGKCDFCEVTGVYIKGLKDGYGDEIMVRCYFGCGHSDNVPNEPDDIIEVVSIQLIDKTLCYDSIWNVQVRVNGAAEDFRLTRFNTETEEGLRKALNTCKNINDLKRLHLSVVHN
jgi:hypothetical protein